MIGKTLAHYEITAKLGEGGMGEVYEATDLNLDRKAAIKILPEDLAFGPDREARFEREAKLLASLSHPNIAGIYGLHRDQSPHFLAMEYVPGEDLAQILGRGPLPAEDAVAIALQIAQALEFAHEHGIVHRDLKPANVRITPDRTTKVLDFGLGKFMESDPEQQDLHDSPTLTAGHTRAGVILGTAAYMSPEQARGTVVDRRADIWAFGCVLYEMLCGMRSFDGETATDVFVSVLGHEPDWSKLPSATPSALRHLLLRCLEKDPLRRLRDIGEARIALEDVLGGESETAAAPPAPRSAVRITGGAVVLAALFFVAGYALRQSDSGSAAERISDDIRVTRLSYTDGLAYEPTLSPDGNYVAYTSDEDGNLDISVLPLAGGNINRVVRHPADDAQPRWSPDGSRLAFVSGRDREGPLRVIGGLGSLSQTVHGNGGDIFLMPALGGNVTKLVENSCYPDWSPDGESVVFQSNRTGNWDIWIIDSRGGDPRQLTDDVSLDYQPAWSPDGRWIVFGTGGDRLCLIPAQGGEKRELYAGDVLSPDWSPDGRWIYFASDRASSDGMVDLWRIPFQPEGDLIDEPQRVTVADGKETGAQLSADGNRLVYGAHFESPDLWRMDVASGAMEELIATRSAEDHPHLSPDGQTLLFDSDRDGTVRLWTLDLLDGTLRQVQTPGFAANARWSPDGDRIAFSSRSKAGLQLLVQRRGGVQATTISTDVTSGPQWSRDGKRLTAYGGGVWIFDSESGSSKRLIEDDASIFPTFSPDGQTIAFQRGDVTETREIWGVSAEGGEPWVIAGGDVEYSHPQWHPRDADKILVVVDHKELALIHVGSGDVEFVTSFNSSTMTVDYPSWSADGSQVYFSVIRRSGDLYMIDGL